MAVFGRGYHSLHQMSDGQHSRISFVVPVRNDAARLALCLSSIKRQAYPAQLIEIVVADNGSTDDSAAVALAAGATVLPLPGLRVSEMRNQVADSAQGDILAFVDADHEIDPAWAASAVETLGRPSVVAAGAPYNAPPNGTWVQRQYDRLRRHHAGVREVDWLGSGNLAVWRRPFHAVGGFDT